MEGWLLPGPGCESLGFHFSASRQHGCLTRGHQSGCRGSSRFQHPVPSEYRPLGGRRGDATQLIPRRDGNPILCGLRAEPDARAALHAGDIYHLEIQCPILDCAMSDMLQGLLPEAGTWIQAWPLALSYLEGRLRTGWREVTVWCSLLPEEKGRGNWTGNSVSCVLGPEHQHAKERIKGWFGSKSLLSPKTEKEQISPRVSPLAVSGRGGVLRHLEMKPMAAGGGI